LNQSEPLGYLDPENRKLVRRNATLYRSRVKIPPETPKKELRESFEPNRARMGVRFQLFPTITHDYMYQLLQYSEFAAIFPRLAGRHVSLANPAMLNKKKPC
jgi:hypothetical protein